jgi:hypothetical protein
MPERRSLSLVEPITLSLSKFPLLHRMASNDNGKHKMEAESSTVVRKCLQHTNDDNGDDDSSDSPEEPEEEEVSSEVPSMKIDTSEEKLYARRARGYLIGNDGDTPSTSLDTPSTLKSHRRSDEESSDDDDFWM